MQDSWRHLPPNIRSYFMDKAGFDMWPAVQARPESTGLRILGKWGDGPSYSVTGRDSIVYLSRGSQVVVINYADTGHPRVLNYIEAPGLVAKSILVGNRLYVSSGYIETFDVSDPASPVKLGSVLAHAPAMDVVDTLVYTLYQDSFKVFNFSNPDSPQLLGACRDSGYNLSVCNGYAYLGDRWGLYVLDVTNPANPHRITVWGTDIIDVKARGNICCATLGNPNDPAYLKFYVLDARNPANIASLGSLDSCGGYDVYLEDSLAFISGYYTGGHEFEILNIADSTEPTRIGMCLTPGDGFGIWTLTSLHRSFVADDLAGLTVIDVSVPTSPKADTIMLRAGMSMDIAVQGDLACVANDEYGMVLLDVSLPSHPEQIGTLDSTTQIVTRAVAVRDSFAYMGFSPSLGRLHTVDISDPTHPVSAGGVDLFNWPEAIALRDSFVYCAEANRFQVVNIARPREPVLVGSCVTSTNAGEVKIADTIAYITGSPLKIINVARPDSPVVIGNCYRGVSGLDVIDTVLYAVGQNAQFWTLSVADPASPRLLDSVTLPSYDGEDVVVLGSTAFASENVIRILDVSDPSNLRIVGQASVPYWTTRLVYAEPYLYACCAEGGICVLETVPPGVAEIDGTRRPRGLTVLPSVTNGRLVVEDRGLRVSAMLSVFDVTGNEVLRPTMPAQQGEASGRWPVDLSRLPAGVYVLRLGGKGVTETGKVIITRR